MVATSLARAANVRDDVAVMAQDDVLSHLPRTRAGTRSAKRGGPAAAAATGMAAPAKTKTKAKPPVKAKTTAKAAAKPKPKPRTEVPKPAPVVASVEPPSGQEILTSAVQAVGELAAVGVTVGKQLLKGALSRLPRP